jgi:indolepyruvate decarboxylase
MATVASFLIERLENAGIKHIFGVPGDYVLKFYDHLFKSDIELINATDENHAGFTADAYARVQGSGCICVTYSVGALKVANAVACAYAEKSPLVIISGAPGIKEREDGVLLHHTVRSFDSQREIFKNITCASIILDNPATAGYEIDAAFEALNHNKLPIYIELPRDIAEKPIKYDVGMGTPTSPKSDLEVLDEAVEEVVGWINEAENPVILAGVEVARFDLGQQLIKFAEKTNIPVTTTLLAKSVVSETHPLFAGIYAGSASQEGVQELVEGSDCLLMFGVLLTDMTLSFQPKKFDKRQVAYCSVSELKIKNHTYTDVVFSDFCKDLFKQEVKVFDDPIVQHQKETKKFIPQRGAKITVKRLFEKINSTLDEDMAILADIGDSLFGAADLVVHDSNQFLSPAFYTSMGSAIPGALGVQVAKPELRPIVIVGDGAFQMSCTELSTVVDRGLNPIIFVINNGGYTTERFLLDGPFNDIRKWEYDKITEMLGGGKGFCVENEQELEAAVEFAVSSKELTVINVIAEAKDISPALERMAAGLVKRV